MKVILGGQYQPLLDGATVQVSRSMSDPVPTCSLSLNDNNSSLFVQAMQELIVLDDQVIPNPTINLLQNPTLNPYTSKWTVNSFSGITLSQNTGGGVIITLASPAPTTFNNLTQVFGGGYTVPGQVYVMSAVVQGSSSPVNFLASITMEWLDAAGNHLNQVLANSAFPPSTTPTMLTCSGSAPAGAAFMRAIVGVAVASSPATGAVTFTNIQLEPQWFPTLSYPTAFCGPSQTNCVQLPIGQWIRQYRKFAGFVNHATYGNYHGNVRDVMIDAVGYAWLLSTILCNNAYTNKTDAFIFTDLLNSYVTSNGVALVGTANIITGVTLSSVQSNWDDIRSVADNLASQSGYYWTIDYYWQGVYAPPGYFSMPIALIADNSGNPDMVTTFPAYNFSAEMDYTQPASTVLVLGNGANTAKVIDGSTVSANGFASGYFLPAGSSYMRKVNENALNSVADCTQRGIAEMLQYDYARNVYHLTTNVELIPGYGIQVTSNTDNLNKSTQLIQQTKSSWLGTSELLKDTWEYQSDLGATNRNATHIMSRLFRLTNGNSAATAIAATTLAVIERLGIMETPAQGGLATGYQPTILADGPVAYYRLGELLGTIADDYSGSAYQGTLNGTVTLNQAGAILSDSNAAMKFDGTSGYIALPSGLSTSAWTAFTVEAWVNLTSTPTVGNPRIVANSKTDIDFHGFELIINRVGLTISFSLGTGTVANTITSTSALVVGTYAYVSATFNGTQMILYVNGIQQVATTFTSFSINASSNPVNLGRNVTGNDNFLPATIDEPAIYHATLTRYQIQQHYAVATSPYAVVVRADSPLAYYRLDEPSGTTAYDWSGNSSDSTLSGTVTLSQAGALTVSGDNDTAMKFDGSTGYVALPSGVNPAGWTAFSVELWVNLTGTFTGNPRIIANSHTDTDHNGFELKINGGGTVTLGIGNGTTRDGANSTSALVAGTYAYIVGTYDGAKIRMYFNGVLQGTISHTGAISSSGFVINIGRNPAYAGDYTPATIDEPAIYNAALSQAQITAHYNAGI